MPTGKAEKELPEVDVGPGSSGSDAEERVRIDVGLPRGIRAEKRELSRLPATPGRESGSAVAIGDSPGVDPGRYELVRPTTKATSLK